MKDVKSFKKFIRIEIKKEFVLDKNRFVKLFNQNMYQT